MKTKLTLLSLLASMTLHAHATENIIVGSVRATSVPVGRTFFGSYRDLNRSDSQYLALGSQPYGEGNLTVLDATLGGYASAYGRVRSLDLTFEASRTTLGLVTIWLMNWSTLRYEQIGRATLDPLMQTMRYFRRDPHRVNAYMNSAGQVNVRCIAPGYRPFTMLVNQLRLVVTAS